METMLSNLQLPGRVYAALASSARFINSMHLFIQTASTTVILDCLIIVLSVFIFSRYPVDIQW